MDASPSNQRGSTALELVLIAAIIALLAVIVLPRMGEAYFRASARGAAATVRTVVLQARMSALKEKNAYRLVVHDETAATPNRVEIQREESGSFVALAVQPEAFADVDVLGIGSTDSVDVISVNSRGQCTTGKVFLQGQEFLSVVDVETTCLTTLN